MKPLTGRELASAEGGDEVPRTCYGIEYWLFGKRRCFGVWVLID